MSKRYKEAIIISSYNAEIAIIGEDCLLLAFSSLPKTDWFNVLISCKLFHKIGNYRFVFAIKC